MAAISPCEGYEGRLSLLIKKGMFSIKNWKTKWFQIAYFGIVRNLSWQYILMSFITHLWPANFVDQQLLMAKKKITFLILIQFNQFRN